MFTVHSRGVFTHDKSGYFSNSKVYGKKWDREKVFTIKECSLIRTIILHVTDVREIGL